MRLLIDKRIQFTINDKEERCRADMLLWESRALARAGEGRSGPGQGKRLKELIQAASWVQTLAGGIEESEEGGVGL